MTFGDLLSHFSMDTVPATAPKVAATTAVVVTTTTPTPYKPSTMVVTMLMVVGCDGMFGEG